MFSADLLYLLNSHCVIRCIQGYEKRGAYKLLDVNQQAFRKQFAKGKARHACNIYQYLRAYRSSLIGRGINVSRLTVCFMWIECVRELLNIVQDCLAK